MAAVDRLLSPAIDELTRDVRRALSAFCDATTARIVRIYVTGGGCDQFGLLREWSREATAADSAAVTLTGGANENEIDTK